MAGEAAGVDGVVEVPHAEEEEGEEEEEEEEMEGANLESRIFLVRL